MSIPAAERGRASTRRTWAEFTRACAAPRIQHIPALGGERVPGAELFQQLLHVGVNILRLNVPIRPRPFPFPLRKGLQCSPVAILYQPPSPLQHWSIALAHRKPSNLEGQLASQTSQPLSVRWLCWVRINEAVPATGAELSIINSSLSSAPRGERCGIFYFDGL